MIPGNKVGFIIGKGGAGIRGLQEKAGVKMVIFQESAQANTEEKQLRITGPPDRVDYAKKLVEDMLNERDDSSRMRRDNFGVGPGGGGGGGVGGGGGWDRDRGFNDNRTSDRGSRNLNEYGSGSRLSFQELPVSPNVIGMVIGKGGENIRKIQAETGCKVQFDTTKLDAQGNKICQFTGTQEEISKAIAMVKELIDNIGGGAGQEEVRLIVPAARTGSVIGRGGENIRQLKQQSGCNIELDKNFQNENDERCFIIRGSADKVAYAQQLVTDKVGRQEARVLSSTIPQYDQDSQYGYMSSQAYQRQGAAGSSTTDYYQVLQAAAADGNSQASVQEQYAMWAAYYAQYSQAQQQMGNGAAEGSAATAGAGAAAGSAEQNEEAYEKWIEYYKAYGMVFEAETMEKSLAEFRKQKKSDDNGNKHHEGSNSKGSHRDHHESSSSSSSHHRSRRNGDHSD